MYCIVDLKGTSYGVLDTKDGVVEYFNYTNMCETFNKCNLKVVGISNNRVVIPNKFLEHKRSEASKMDTASLLKLIKDNMSKEALGDSVSIESDKIRCRFAGGIRNWYNREYERLEGYTPDVCDADAYNEEASKVISNAIYYIKKKFGVVLDFINYEEKGYGCYCIIEVNEELGVSLAKEDIDVISCASKKLSESHLELASCLGIKRSLGEIYNVFGSMCKYKSVSGKQKKYALLAYLIYCM